MALSPLQTISGKPTRALESLAKTCWAEAWQLCVLQRRSSRRRMLSRAPNIRQRQHPRSV
eukprot:4870048-Prymnesium_polylepis.1